MKETGVTLRFVILQGPLGTTALSVRRGEEARDGWYGSGRSSETSRPSDSFGVLTLDVLNTAHRAERRDQCQVDSKSGFKRRHVRNIPEVTCVYCACMGPVISLNRSPDQTSELSADSVGQSWLRTSRFTH